MNYIKALEKENSELRVKIVQSDVSMTDFMKYLQSSKFHNDTTIQTSEVFNFLQNLRNDLYI